MAELKTSAGYLPTGDQPRAIEEITRSLQAGERYQTLLGATGTGKTATMAWIIEQIQKPALKMPTRAAYVEYGGGCDSGATGYPVPR